MAIFRPGSDTASGDLNPNELWLPIFSGETYLAFEENNIFGGMVSMPVMQKGLEFIFNYFGTASSETHESGATIVGTGIAKTQRSVYVDERPLFTAAEFDDVDELFAQWEYRSNVALEHGRELARQLDKRTAKLIVKAAQTQRPGALTEFRGGNPNGNGGYVLLANGGNILTGWNAAGNNRDRAVLILKAIDNYNVNADQINLPEGEQTYCVVTPAVWHAMRDIQSVIYVPGSNGYNGSPMAADMTIPGNPNPGIHAGMMRKDYLMYKGVHIYQSNNIPTTNTTSTEPTNTWGGDFTNTVGMIWKKSSVGLAIVRGVKVETGRNVSTQSDLLVSSIHTGGGGLRVEGAWQLVNDSVSPS
jgi:hypothetical protein